MIKSSLLFPIILCLTIGLAPFFPEPHIWGKIKWLLGGANGMGLIDYFDLLLHGAPWIYLLVRVLSQLKNSQ